MCCNGSPRSRSRPPLPPAGSSISIGGSWLVPMRFWRSLRAPTVARYSVRLLRIRGLSRGSWSTLRIVRSSTLRRTFFIADGKRDPISSTSSRAEQYTSR